MTFFDVPKTVAARSHPPESAIAPATNPAAAELDHFSLREKIGTQTVLAECPGLVASAKHGLIDSGGCERAATSYRVLKKMIKESAFLKAPNACRGSQKKCESNSELQDLMRFGGVAAVAEQSDRCLGFSAYLGGFREHCLSPNFFAQRKMVELRSGPDRRKSLRSFSNRGNPIEPSSNGYFRDI